MNDIYQERYLEHQAKKKKQLTKGDKGMKLRYPVHEQSAHHALLWNRRSQRTFNSEPVEDHILQQVLNAATYAPSSCNRHGIKLVIVREKAEKELLGGLLVGGVGWVHRADTIVLFMADPAAYKSPNEKEFMHYCDVGFTAMNIWLKAESLGLGAAYVNPNIRSEHEGLFGDYFEEGHIFCGALAIGNYDERAEPAKQPELNDIRLWIK